MTKTEIVTVLEITNDDPNAKSRTRTIELKRKEVDLMDLLKEESGVEEESKI